MSTRNLAAIGMLAVLTGGALVVFATLDRRFNESCFDKIIVPSIVILGTPFDVTVAVDRFGNIDTNYRGTVTFSTSDTDPGVILPTQYTFTIGDSGDNGVHSFFGGVTLLSLGDQTLTVTDTNSGITTSVTITVTPPG